MSGIMQPSTLSEAWERVAKGVNVSASLALWSFMSREVDNLDTNTTNAITASAMTVRSPSTANRVR